MNLLQSGESKLPRLGHLHRFVIQPQFSAPGHSGDSGFLQSTPSPKEAPTMRQTCDSANDHPKMIAFGYVLTAMRSFLYAYTTGIVYAYSRVPCSLNGDRERSPVQIASFCTNRGSTESGSCAETNGNLLRNHLQRNITVDLVTASETQRLESERTRSKTLGTDPGYWAAKCVV